ncbi:hypothetical protein FTUN_6420 [Frigoriglobus tundricola]|uniref:Uncharacterized protein n=1 Tax=Frigoriglobus tundricola TaxID=2774151 RepID=A0A6M5YXV0_9BACT|nr:hypothetical protein FTUN_6420 [Frigoriglobus tundricola]
MHAMARRRIVMRIGASVTRVARPPSASSQSLLDRDLQQ